MKTTDDRIYEICEKVGYNNPQYFSVIFKKYMGVSPREYGEIKYLAVPIQGAAFSYFSTGRK